MRKKHIAWQWLSAVVISLLMFSAPPLRAGNLNPSAPPAPTMKTLDQAPAKDEVIPPWSQTIPGTERFKLVLGGAGVLDKETGLVWEQSPSIYTYIWVWSSGVNGAHIHCTGIPRGGRLGWRLPTLQELSSLVDRSVSDSPKLPSGHPFSNVQPSGGYWTDTTSIYSTTYAMVVNFWTGPEVYHEEKSEAHYVWCVRGGSGPDTQ